MRRLEVFAALATLALLAACSAAGITPSPGNGATSSPAPEITPFPPQGTTFPVTPESDRDDPASSPGPVVLLQEECLIDLKVDAQGLFWSTCNGTVVISNKASGEPRVIAVGQHTPRHIVVDEDNVYWLEGNNETGFSIIKLSKQGGEPMRLAQSGMLIPAFAVDHTHAYWSTCPAFGAKLWKVPKQGGTPVVVAEATCATSIALTEEYVFWIDGGLRRAKKDGSGAEMLLPDAGLDDAVASIGVGLRPEYHAVGISQIIRVDGADVALIVYINNNPGLVSCTDNHSDLLRFSTQGDTLEHWPGVASNSYVATDEQRNVLLASSDCWSNGQGIVVITDTGRRFAVAAAEDGRKGPLAADETYIYWWNQEAQTLEKLKK